MEIYNDKYIKYVFEKENSLLIFYWSSDTKNMTNEKYKELMLKVKVNSKTKKTKKIITFAENKKSNYAIF